MGVDIDPKRIAELKPGPLRVHPIFLCTTAR